LREIHIEKLIEIVKDLVIQANTELPDDVLSAFEEGLKKEESPIGIQILKDLIENAKIAHKEKVPICQDTGMAILFVEIGQEVQIVGGDLHQALLEGVRLGYQEGYFRKSTLDPIERINFGDNTPPIVHIDIVPGDKLKINVMTKGFGGEMMSHVKLFAPFVGMEGIKDEVVRIVSKAGANPCPPIIVGIGIGGNLEKAALIAKKSLLRKIGERNPNPKVAQMEEELFERINKLGIGPGGLGGSVTCLAVNIETFPTHIASIPLAVNIQCNAHRHKEAIL
jgi:fumarate hydratase subunit alpha